MKRKITALSFIALLASMFLLQGCSAVNTIYVAGKTYTYTGESAYGTENDPFTIRLDTNGRFAYHETVYSSYLGIGTWSVDGNVLTLTDDDKRPEPVKNSFRIEGDDLIFIETGSTNFLYVKVEDGERFTSE